MLLNRVKLPSAGETPDELQMLLSATSLCNLLPSVLFAKSEDIQISVKPVLQAIRTLRESHEDCSALRSSIELEVALEQCDSKLNIVHCLS